MTASSGNVYKGSIASEAFSPAEASRHPATAPGSRLRILAQLLTESLLLALPGVLPR